MATCHTIPERTLILMGTCLWTIRRLLNAARENYQHDTFTVRRTRGGNSNLIDILSAQINDLDIECDEADFPLLARSFIQAEVAYAGATLTDPIDDPEEKDPQSILEAQSSVYWTHWLTAIYEELESERERGL